MIGNGMWNGTWKFTCLLQRHINTRHTHLLLRFLIREVCLSLPHPGLLRSTVALHVHPGRDVVVSAHLQRLLPPHEDPGGLILLLLHDPHVSGASLLPLRGLALHRISDYTINTDMLNS